MGNKSRTATRPQNTPRMPEREGEGGGVLPDQKKRKRSPRCTESVAYMALLFPNQHVPTNRANAPTPTKNHEPNVPPRYTGSKTEKIRQRTLRKHLFASGLPQRHNEPSSGFADRSVSPIGPGTNYCAIASFLQHHNIVASAPPLPLLIIGPSCIPSSSLLPPNEEDSPVLRRRESGANSPLCKWSSFDGDRPLATL